jgi:hypothetical protein
MNGGVYRTVTTPRAGDMVAPSAFPRLVLRVADLLVSALPA